MASELTEDEVKALRELIRADQRRQWLISGVKAVSIWIIAIAGAATALKTMGDQWFK